MKKEIIFQIKSPYRDDFRIHAFRFGEGKKSLAVVGARNGDEIQQQYICSQLINKLSIMEEKGEIEPDHEILVIPSVNPFSMNSGKGGLSDSECSCHGSDRGETTQRLAGAIFSEIVGYRYGVQLEDCFRNGDTIPHVSMMEAGSEAICEAALFGHPYICMHNPMDSDASLQNYNCRLWKSRAFSVCGGQGKIIDEKRCLAIIESIIRFMAGVGIIKPLRINPGFKSDILHVETMHTIKADAGGILLMRKSPNDKVCIGDTLAQIINPYEGNVLSEIKSATNGVVFFTHNKPLVLQATTLFGIIPE